LKKKNEVNSVERKITRHLSKAKIAEHLKKEAMNIKKEIINKISSLITAAFAFVAALAWNDAIKNAIVSLHLEKYGPLLYAILVTIIAVVASVWVGRIAGKMK